MRPVPTETILLPRMTVPTDTLSVSTIGRFLSAQFSGCHSHFLKMAKSRGSRTVDGLGMLIHQGIPGFEAWFGQTPLVTEELRKILLK